MPSVAPSTCRLAWILLGAGVLAACASVTGPTDVALVDAVVDAPLAYSDHGTTVADCGSLTSCDGECIHATSNPANCGACGHACSFSCGAGACDEAVGIGAGFANSCARRESGTVVCWGDNLNGQIGDGTSRNERLLPTEVAGVSDAVDLAVGARYACALRSAGSVVCWGRNDLGQIGDGTIGIDRLVPVAVMNVFDGVEIATGETHACARRASGTVVCWGDDASGQLGDGTMGGSRLVPVAVAGLSDAVELAAGIHHTCARRASGTVVCWGHSNSGQLGDGSYNVIRPTPVTVAGLSDAIGIAAGEFHTCAVRANGTVLCWGDAPYLFGDELFVSRTTPVAIQGVSDAVEIQTAGGGVSAHACVRRASGVVMCWGVNSDGEVGDGTLEDRLAPVAVVGVDDAVELAAGADHMCVRRSSGQIFCWGLRFACGVGSSANLLTPVRVMVP